MYSSGCDGIQSDSIGVDEALVTISSELSVSVWSQSTECWQVGCCSDCILIRKFLQPHGAKMPKVYEQNNANKYERYYGPRRECVQQL